MTDDNVLELTAKDMLGSAPRIEGIDGEKGIEEGRGGGKKGEGA